MGATLLHLDDHLMAVDKPAGLSLATPPRDPSGALERLWAALPSSARKAAGIPGGWTLLHRLDVGTSGVLLLARAGADHRLYTALWQAGKAHKRYLALAWGAVEPEVGRFSDLLAPDPVDRRKMRVHPSGKRAATPYRVVASSRVASLVEAGLETGRTHQVRVHFAHAGHPLLGDDLYGRLRDIPEGVTAEERRALQPGRCLLHAWCIALPPTELGPALQISAPPPQDFTDVLTRLGFTLPSPDGV